MKTYKILIIEESVYIVEAENEEEAEKKAWEQYESDPVQPLNADIESIEEVKSN